jgi:hypothetical protein
MIDQTTAREDRSVHIETVDGAVQGCLRISPGLRTLDDLNLVSKRFITVHTPQSLASDWEPGSGPLAVNKGSILFVRELSAPPPKGGGRFGNFTRAALRLRIKEFEVEGFVHVPPGGSPMKRLDQDSHPFVSLTTVLVTGPDGHATAPFLAVNRNHITAAQVNEPGEEPAAVHSAEAASDI